MKAIGEYYLCLCETPHRKRYWRMTSDPKIERDKVKFLGPALVGPDGYATLEEAAQAIADQEEIDLNDPDTWYVKFDGVCPLCDGRNAVLIDNDAADLNAYCPDCKEYFEYRP